MGKDVYITSDTNGDRLLARGIMDYFVEARVEQELSAPYRFAVRFEEDICGDFMENGTLEPLQPGRTIAIIVKDSDESEGRCLVRGPVTKVKTSIVTGGAGSWFEIHGEDNRHLLDITTMSAAYAGTASEVAAELFGQLPFSVSDEHIEQTIIAYTDEEPLHQASTDLGLLNSIARTNNFEFWIEYALVSGPFADGATLSINENWFLRSSPPRPGARMKSEGALSGAALSTLVSSDISIPLLSGGDEHPLRVNGTSDGACINVLSFALDVDAERASVAYFTEVDPSTGQLRTNEAFTPQPAVDQTPDSGQRQGVFRHEGVAENVGSPEEQRLQAEAALTEASWFVKAACSTATHLYDNVLFPNQLVQVAGVGAMHSGTYQVTNVIHVVKPTAHLMDLKLRRNTLNLSEVRDTSEGEMLEVANG